MAGTDPEPPPLRLVAPIEAVVDELGVEECFDHLVTCSVGRVVFTDGALPAITPVCYAVDGWQIFFRPSSDHRLQRAITGAVVALEADQLNDDLQAGWSVVVTGVAQACTHPSQWPRIAGLNLVPPNGLIEQVFMISPGIISGRRLREHVPPMG